MNIQDKINIRSAINEMQASDDEILDVFEEAIEYIKLVRSQTTLWTEDEVELLIELVERGEGHAQIGDILGRSTSAITHKCQRVGIKTYIKWTVKDLEQLRDLISEGLTHPQIADILGRSTNAIEHKCKLHCIKSPSVWTSEEIDLLIELVAHGETRASIVDQLYRSTAAIDGKCWRLGIKILNGGLKTHDQYKQDLPNTITVIGEYINSSTKIEHQCNICNTIWNVIPSSILRGKGCPTCARVKTTLHWDKDESIKEQALLVKDYLYIMQCNTNIKVGVSVSPSRRLSEIKNASSDQSWHLIHTLETNTWDAYILESKIRKEFNSYPSTHKWAGHTELHYTSDLDKILEFIQKQLKEQ